MSYTVVWHPDAEEQLAAIWNVTADRRAVSDAADEIDRVLNWGPADAGESRSGTERHFIIRPLAVVFAFDIDDRRVRELSVIPIE